MTKRRQQGILSRIFRRSGVVVPVVRLAGTISAGTSMRPGLSLAAVNDTLERAFSRKGISAVALAINSPGGSPVQSTLIHNRIRSLAEKHEVKVFAFCEDVAASGGYMLAMAGDEIYADESSIVGSIGVVSAGFGFVDAIKKLGIQRRVHTAGENKAILDPFQPEKKEDIERLKEFQLDIHAVFKNMVRERRAGKLPEQEGELFTGAFWPGRKAKDLGLVDGIGDLHGILREKFGDKLKIKAVQRPNTLSIRRLFAQEGHINDKILATLGQGLTEDALGALEARALWQRYGL